MRFQSSLYLGLGLIFLPILTSSCNLKKVKAHQEASPFTQVEAASTSDAKGVTSYAVQPVAGKSVGLSASSSSAIAGSKIVLAPGSLLGASEISIEEGEDLSARRDFISGLGITAPQKAAPSLVLSSSQPFQAAVPMKISMNMPKALALATRYLTVVYAFQTLEGTQIGVVKTRSIIPEDGHLAFEFMSNAAFYKVSFQLIYVGIDIVEDVQIPTTQPIATPAEVAIQKEAEANPLPVPIAATPVPVPEVAPAPAPVPAPMEPTTITPSPVAETPLKPEVPVAQPNKFEPPTVRPDCGGKFYAVWYSTQHTGEISDTDSLKVVFCSPISPVQGYFGAMLAIDKNRVDPTAMLSKTYVENDTVTIKPGTKWVAGSDGLGLLFYYADPLDRDSPKARMLKGDFFVKAHVKGIFIPPMPAPVPVPVPIPETFTPEPAPAPIPGPVTPEPSPVPTPGPVTPEPVPAPILTPVDAPIPTPAPELPTQASKREPPVVRPACADPYQAIWDSTQYLNEISDTDSLKVVFCSPVSLVHDFGGGMLRAYYLSATEFRVNPTAELAKTYIENDTLIIKAGTPWAHGKGGLTLAFEFQKLNEEGKYVGVKVANYPFNPLVLGPLYEGPALPTPAPGSPVDSPIDLPTGTPETPVLTTPPLSPLTGENKPPEHKPTCSAGSDLVWDSAHGENPFYSTFPLKLVFCHTILSVDKVDGGIVRRGNSTDGFVLENVLSRLATTYEENDTVILIPTTTWVGEYTDFNALVRFQDTTDPSLPKIIDRRFGFKLKVTQR